MTRILTCSEAAVELRCSAATVRRLICDGELPSVRIGRRLYVPTAAVETLLAGRTQPKGDNG